MTAGTVIAEGHAAQPFRVLPGVHLLEGIERGPSLAAHQRRYPRLPPWTGRALVDLLGSLDVRGRGGSGFPFATKLEAALAAPGRPTVVVNVSEGEPASFKDAALSTTRPHLVLDGAALVAGALGARTVHVVVPSERPFVEHGLRRAIAERRTRARRGRRDRGVRWLVHRADDRFVAGQAWAVIELISGRANLPVTSWQPAAVKGYRGRPTLLSNAETFAQVALAALDGEGRYRAYGWPEEPGTVLLTVHEGSAPRRVVEVDHGTPWSEVLSVEALAGPVLVGGYHGTWAAPGALAGLRVSRSAMRERGLALGAGVVLPLAGRECPVHVTAGLTAYLAEQSAGRCGPCRNGLPALAVALHQLDAGRPSIDRVTELGRVVSGRGACAHPDGTVRLVRSLVEAFPEEIAAHAEGSCLCAGPGLGR